MKRLRFPVLAVLLAMASGCVRYVAVADGPARTTDLADDLLRIESETDGDHVILHIDRGTRIVKEQDFVRQRAGGDFKLLEMRDPRVASLSFSGESGEAIFAIAAYALAGIASVVYEGVVFVAEGVGEVTGLFAPRLDGRTTESWMAVRWEPSPGATLDPADGGPPIDLGPQPPGGYDLGPDVLERLGPPDRPVVIHDGSRTTSRVLRRFH